MLIAHIFISYAHTSYAHVYQGPMPDGVTCCPKNHFGFLASGKMKIMMVETGEEQVISAGEAYYVPPKVCFMLTVAVLYMIRYSYHTYIWLFSYCSLLQFQHDAIMLEDTVMLEFESTAAEYYGKLDDK